jgi:hypothetical protein
MAESGEAMEGGEFPIKTKKDLENAVQAYGRAKDKAKAKAHIIARAKALDATDMLPEDWEGSTKEKSEKATGGDLKKGLHEVARMACLIQDLDWLQTCLENEAEWERDDSPLPAELKSQIGNLCTFLRALVEEETEELFDDDDDVEVEVMEMAAGHFSALKKFVEGKEKLKKAAEALEKAGARHSKADMDRVQKMHDEAHEMHKCMGDMAEKCVDMHKSAAVMKNTAIDLGASGEKTEDEHDGKADKAVAGELAKMTAKHDTLVKVLTELTPKVSDMLKRVETQNERLVEQAARIDHLEKQPMPPKGSTRAVEKGGTPPTDADVLSLLKGKSKDEVNHLLMKAALSNPVQHLE